MKTFFKLPETAQVEKALIRNAREGLMFLKVPKEISSLH